MHAVAYREHDGSNRHEAPASAITGDSKRR
jgi:hypothetical protein